MTQAIIITLIVCTTICLVSFAGAVTAMHYFDTVHLLKLKDKK